MFHSTFLSTDRRQKEATETMEFNLVRYFLKIHGVKQEGALSHCTIWSLETERPSFKLSKLFSKKPAVKFYTQSWD